MPLHIVPMATKTSARKIQMEKCSIVTSNRITQNDRVNNNTNSDCNNINGHITIIWWKQQQKKR